MDIKLSSNDNSRHRTMRLNRVLGFTTRVHKKLISLHDDKGNLTVRSFVPLTSEDKKLFKYVWASDLCNESSDTVLFEVSA